MNNPPKAPCSAATTLLEVVLAAHGGRERWARLHRIDARLSSGGFAFSSKFQSDALHGLDVSIFPHEGRVILRNFCQPQWQGLWAADHVQIRDERTALVSERYDPRAHFDRLTSQLYWDKLDILYFAGYALWNYLSFPFILDLPGVTLSQMEPPTHDGNRYLRAHFSDDIPTHSAEQVFVIDGSNQLVRHDYTADVIGRWATAGNCCLASGLVGGLRFYTRRKVYPCFNHRHLMPFPTLVWIELDDIWVTSS